MARTDFSKRFRELVKGLSDTELGFILGVSADAARKMRNGDIKSLKLHAALKLARQLQISPWYLAAEPEPDMRGKVRGIGMPPDQQLTTRLRNDKQESTLRQCVDSLAACITRIEELMRNEQPRP